MLKKIMVGIIVFLSTLLVCTISAAAKESDFSFVELDSGEVCLAKYKGNDKEVVIPSEYNGKPVTQIGFADYYDGAFTSNQNINKVIIPDSVKIINRRSFRYCKNLSEVVIPNGVESIGYEAFYNCSSLMDISIPQSITQIGQFAFKNTNLLNSSKGDFVFVDGWLVEYRNKDIDTINIPKSTRGLGDGVFRGFENLKTVIIEDGVQVIGGYSFWKCPKLASVEIPKSIKVIGEEAFAGCENLTSVNIPGNSVTIGKHAYSVCNSLKSVTINEADVIGTNAFYYCSALKSVIISDGIKEISPYCFKLCSNLKSITIPQSVTAIEKAAFDKCVELTDIYYEGTKADWEKIDIDFSIHSSFEIGIGNDMLRNGLVTIHYNADISGVSSPKGVSSVTGLRFTRRTNSISMKWNPSENAKGYIVEQYVNGKWVRVAKVCKTTYTVKGLDNATKYKFRIKAYGKVNSKTIYSKYKSFTVSTK